MKSILRTLKLILTKRIAQPEKLDGMDKYSVLVTGASKGIGLAIAETLLVSGARVGLMARSFEEDLSGLVDTHKDNIILITGDVTNESDVSMAVEQICDSFGSLDVLINNAGSFSEKPVEDLEGAELDRVIDTNVKSLFLTAKYAVPVMKSNKAGLIINIGSKISRNTNVAPNKTLYATSKYAVEGFSNALRKELKPFGIRVTCLMPATVNTFISAKAGNFLSPYRVAQVVSMLIYFKDVDFENFVIKSVHQDI
ncbi:SDR family oxidoreductase [Patescibacteria group bacterium]|nr:SDR family oxidoreductase [Patescibacteria group bacterium]